MNTSPGNKNHFQEITDKMELDKKLKLDKFGVDHNFVEKIVGFNELSKEKQEIVLRKIPDIMLRVIRDNADKVFNEKTVGLQESNAQRIKDFYKTPGQSAKPEAANSDEPVVNEEEDGSKKDSGSETQQDASGSSAIQEEKSAFVKWFQIKKIKIGNIGRMIKHGVTSSFQKAQIEKEKYNSILTDDSKVELQKIISTLVLQIEEVDISISHNKKGKPVFEFASPELIGDQDEKINLKESEQELLNEFNSVLEQYAKHQSVERNYFDSTLNKNKKESRIVIKYEQKKGQILDLLTKRFKTGDVSENLAQAFAQKELARIEASAFLMQEITEDPDATFRLDQIESLSGGRLINVIRGKTGRQLDKKKSSILATGGFFAGGFLGRKVLRNADKLIESIADVGVGTADLVGDLSSYLGIPGVSILIASRRAKRRSENNERKDYKKIELDNVRTSEKYQQLTLKIKALDERIKKDPSAIRVLEEIQKAQLEYEKGLKAKPASDSENENSPEELKSEHLEKLKELIENNELLRQRAELRKQRNELTGFNISDLGENLNKEQNSENPKSKELFFTPAEQLQKRLDYLSKKLEEKLEELEKLEEDKSDAKKDIISKILDIKNQLERRQKDIAEKIKSGRVLYAKAMVDRKGELIRGTFLSGQYELSKSLAESYLVIASIEDKLEDRKYSELVDTSENDRRDEWQELKKGAIEDNVENAVEQVKKIKDNKSNTKITLTDSDFEKYDNIDQAVEGRYKKYLEDAFKKDKESFTERQKKAKRRAVIISGVASIFGVGFSDLLKYSQGDNDTLWNHLRELFRDEEDVADVTTETGTGTGTGTEPSLSQKFDEIIRKIKALVALDVENSGKESGTGSTDTSGTLAVEPTSQDTTVVDTIDVGNSENISNEDDELKSIPVDREKSIYNFYTEDSKYIHPDSNNINKIDTIQNLDPVAKLEQIVAKFPAEDQEIINDALKNNNELKLKIIFDKNSPGGPGTTITGHDLNGNAVTENEPYFDSLLKIISADTENKLDTKEEILEELKKQLLSEKGFSSVEDFEKELLREAGSPSLNGQFPVTEIKKEIEDEISKASHYLENLEKNKDTVEQLVRKFDNNNGTGFSLADRTEHNFEPDEAGTGIEDTKNNLGGETETDNISSEEEIETNTAPKENEESAPAENTSEENIESTKTKIYGLKEKIVGKKELATITREPGKNGITWVLKNQLDGNDDLKKAAINQMKQIGTTANDQHLLKIVSDFEANSSDQQISAKFYMELGKQFGYIKSDGSVEVRVNTPGSSYQLGVSSDASGNNIVTIFEKHLDGKTEINGLTKEGKLLDLDKGYDADKLTTRALEVEKGDIEKPNEYLWQKGTRAPNNLDQVTPGEDTVEDSPDTTINSTGRIEYSVRDQEEKVEKIVFELPDVSSDAEKLRSLSAEKLFDSNIVTIKQMANSADSKIYGDLSGLKSDPKKAIKSITRILRENILQENIPSAKDIITIPKKLQEAGLLDDFKFLTRPIEIIDPANSNNSLKFHIPDSVITEYMNDNLSRFGYYKEATETVFDFQDILMARQQFIAEHQYLDSKYLGKLIPLDSNGNEIVKGSIKITPPEIESSETGAGENDRKEDIEIEPGKEAQKTLTDNLLKEIGEKDWYTEFKEEEEVKKVFDDNILKEIKKTEGLSDVDDWREAFKDMNKTEKATFLSNLHQITVNGEKYLINPETVGNIAQIAENSKPNGNISLETYLAYLDHLRTSLDGKNDLDLKKLDSYLLIEEKDSIKNAKQDWINKRIMGTMRDYLRGTRVESSPTS